jgi:2-iminobutanoate/2-iminopropanoate deaminase
VVHGSLLVESRAVTVASARQEGACRHDVRPADRGSEGRLMTREIVQTPDAPGSAAYGKVPYSQAVKAAGLVFVSGQGPFDPGTGAIVGATIKEQTHQALRNVEAILQAAGSSMAKVVSAVLVLKDSAAFAGMNEEWMRWFQVDPPARTGTKHPLDIDGPLISISVVAEA